MKRLKQLIGSIIFCLSVGAMSAAAQTGEFTYEGSVNYNGQPANGNFDFEFRLYDAGSGGAQQGTTLQRLNVTVNNGVFKVTLDFGAAVFTGENRFLETAARPAGSLDPFTVSLPRPQITSVPYTIRSLNSTTADTSTNSLQLDGISASQYVITIDTRLSDHRNPLPNSANYIQNTTAQQSLSNFNISGNGTTGGTLSGNVVNATTQFNLGGNRVLSTAGTNNLFAGVGAGATTTGIENSFFGSGAGRLNTTGTLNSFFGANAGQSNATGSTNSFFGYVAGEANTTGVSNSFFGTFAGKLNTSGNANTFFGYAAGLNNVNGNRNSFFGIVAGELNMTGDDNAFFGYAAGLSNRANGNSFFGSNAGSDNTSGFNNSFFGRNAGGDNATGTGNSFFGNGAGVRNTTSNANSFFGNAAGNSNVTGASNSFFGNAAGNTNTTGSNNTVIGANADVASNNLSFATAIGAGANVSTSNTVVLGRNLDDVRVPGNLVVVTLGAAGTTDVCRNAANKLSTCSSSLRYKTDLQPFVGGLNLVNRLRPISFAWKDGGRRDLGFAAEEVSEVEPLLVTRNAQGQVEGVKYGQLTTVLVNAIRELQAEIDSLKSIVCQDHPDRDFCKQPK